MSDLSRKRGSAPIGNDFNRVSIPCAFPDKERILENTFNHFPYPTKKPKNGKVFHISLVGIEIGNDLYYVKGRKEPYKLKKYAWDYCLKHKIATIVVVPNV